MHRCRINPLVPLRRGLMALAAAPILPLVLLLALAAATDTVAAVVHVPGQYPTVEQGCAAVAEGDTLVIAAGEYEVASATLNSISCTVLGATGDPADVILRPASVNGRVFHCGGFYPTQLSCAHLTFQGSPSAPSSPTGGGIHMEVDAPASVMVLDCVFEHFYNHRGLDVMAYSNRTQGQLVIDCVFRGNVYVNEGGGGGAMSIEIDERAWLRRCQFLDNRTSGNGGALWLEADSVIIEDCTFAGNLAEQGGGAVYLNGPANLTGCTFAGNQSGGAGGVICRDSDSFTPTIHRCVIAFNDDVSIAGDGFAPQPEDLDIVGTDIFGNTGGDWAGAWGALLSGTEHAHRANLAADPMFCDLAGGDYRLQADSSCVALEMGAHGVGCGGTVGVSDQGYPLPQAMQARAYPNPFNPQTTIAFDMATAGPVSVKIFDARGALVRTLVDERRPAGWQEIAWDGRDDSGRALASGVYVSRLEADGRVARRKMALVR